MAFIPVDIGGAILSLPTDLAEEILAAAKATPGVVAEAIVIGERAAPEIVKVAEAGLKVAVTKAAGSWWMWPVKIAAWIGLEQMIVEMFKSIAAGGLAIGAGMYPQTTGTIVKRIYTELDKYTP